jgi:hypothetical protein
MRNLHLRVLPAYTITKKLQKKFPPWIHTIFQISSAQEFSAFTFAKSHLAAATDATIKTSVLDIALDANPFSHIRSRT